MSALAETRHVSVSIDRPPRDVYQFAFDPQNLPRWASGLAGSIARVNGEWVADSPMGRVTIRFAEENALGVLDHDVTLESGVSVHNPMRVLPNGKGSEVLFSVFRRPELTAAQFAEDAETVAKDLQTLKRILEG
jgi:hypothetical protein